MKASRVVREGWLSELWRYRELVYFFAWRDVKVRYKQAALGAGWAIIQPLLNMLVFTLFFGKLVGGDTIAIPYPLFCFCALVLWTYFSGVVSLASQSLVSNSNLVGKVYFPRVALPASNAISGLVDFFIGLICLVAMMVYYRIQPGWSLLLAPVFLLGLVLFTVGVSLILAALNVQFRDIKYTIPFLIQLGLFVTPVIYPISIIPERFRPIASLNPLWGLIEGFRASLFPAIRIDPGLAVGSLTLSAIVFVVGLIYFRGAERDFADII
jgi:lipopolysaccharide transport system permease protein